MKLFLLALLLTSCTRVSTPTGTITSFSTITEIGTWGDVSPKPIPSAAIPAQKVALEKACPAPGAYQAVDSSMPFTQAALFAMRQLGVSTAIRYYEYPVPTIAGKQPSIAEMKLIEANGLSFLGVFQHSNSSPCTFQKVTCATPGHPSVAQDRGTADAKRSVDLAALWKQPTGSAIYFGVDFEPTAAQLKNVIIYATNFAKVVRAAGFKPGAYGSGDTLKALKTAGLVDYTWISQSSGFSGTAAYTASKEWNLLQGMPKDCGGPGFNVDFDKVNGDFGQWKISL